MIFRRMLLIALVLCVAATASAQDGARGTPAVIIKGKKISINYGRPSLKGRDVFSLIQPGMVWRLGMNEATQIETAGDLVVAGKELKAGKYTLWAKKTGADTWVLGFHPKTGVWGDPPLTEGYVAELPLTMSKTTRPSELLTIALAQSQGKARIKVSWGTAVLSGSFDVK
jgi:hypothetical protein